MILQPLDLPQPERVVTMWNAYPAAVSDGGARGANGAPDYFDRRALTEELNSRARVPAYVWKVLEAMPANSHPMCMLDTAILAMQGDSEFVKAYNAGVKKTEFWQSMLED